MTRVSRRYRFSASHRLALPGLSAEENFAKFGKCANPYGHGHDYYLEIRVGGNIDPATGRVINLAQLDAYVRDRVLVAFDHKDMNHDIDDFAGQVPTTENLAFAVSSRLRRDWPFQNIQLDGIGIQETKRNHFELRTE